MIDCGVFPGIKGAWRNDKKGRYCDDSTSWNEAIWGYGGRNWVLLPPKLKMNVKSFNTHELR